MSRVDHLTRQIAKDRAVTRVERLAGELGLSVRGLQRLFAE